MKAFEVITSICAVLAALMLLVAFTGSNGAPQEAAGAAMAVALVVIPYCVLSMLQRKKLIEQGKPPA